MEHNYQYFVVGKGSIGIRHANNLKKLGANVKSYSWREFDERTFLDNIKKYGDRAAIIVATATQVRLPLIKKCSRYGAALYIEKPLAFKEKDVLEIYKLPKNIIQRSMVGFMMRYHPVIKKALDIPMTKIFRGYFEVGSDVKAWRNNWNFEKSYAANPIGGGVLLDLCHEIDIAQLLCGDAEIKSVRATSHPTIKNIDVACDIDFGNANGLNYRVSMDYLAPTLVRTGKIVSTEAVISYDIAKGELASFSAKSEDIFRFEISRNKMFLECMSDFMALVEGRPTSHPYIPVLPSVFSVCLKIAQAWERREFDSRLSSEVL